MALVTLEKSKRTIDKPDEVQEFLRYHGVSHERWEIPTPVQELGKKELLNDEEKKLVLSHYQAQLEKLKLENGYIQNDMVCLCPQTPQIDQLLSKFDRDHYHTDDEVRFIVSGRGIFGFVGKKEEKFSIEVVAGDYIVVPKLNWHWFTLGQSKSIKALRLFQDMSGWVPYYRDQQQPQTALRDSTGGQSLHLNK